MLLPILGTAWVFGVLAVNNQALVFQYVFAVLNSLQVGARATLRWGCWLSALRVDVQRAGCPRAGVTPSLSSLHTPREPIAWGVPKARGQGHLRGTLQGL